MSTRTYHTQPLGPGGVKPFQAAPFSPGIRWVVRIQGDTSEMLSQQRLDQVSDQCPVTDWKPAMFQARYEGHSSSPWTQELL